METIREITAFENTKANLYQELVPLNEQLFFEIEFFIVQAGTPIKTNLSTPDHNAFVLWAKDQSTPKQGQSQKKWRNFADPTAKGCT